MSIIIFVLILCALQPIDSKPEFQVKFLFADTIFSYNLNNLIVDNQPKQTPNQTTIVPANMVPGSFICFILVNSDIEIEMNGADKKSFYLVHLVETRSFTWFFRFIWTRLDLIRIK